MPVNPASSPVCPDYQGLLVFVHGQWELELTSSARGGLLTSGHYKGLVWLHAGTSKHDSHTVTDACN